jgi:ubiquitin C-terminal hydrolase
MQVVHRPKALLLHLKRFMFVEKPIETTAPPNNDVDENQSPNSPSSNKSKHVPVEYVFQKNKAPVRIAESVSLDPFQAEAIEEASVDETKKQYKLKGIVHHLGFRASSGHYTADAVRRIEPTKGDSNKDGKKEEAKDGWVSFDDGTSYVTSLEKITSNRNKQSTAYMLLYALE